MKSNQDLRDAQCAIAKTKRAFSTRLLAAIVLICAYANALADDGDPDLTFSGDGKAIYEWPKTYAGSRVHDVSARSVAALADGSIVVAGTLSASSTTDLCAIVRFDHNGLPDPNFGNAGSSLFDFAEPGAKSEALGVFPAPAGKMLVVGDVQTMGAPEQRPALARLLANGQLDASFGVGGRRIIQTQPLGAGASMYFRTVAMAPDGKIVLVGSCTNCGGGSPDDFLAVRLNPDGTVDSSFGTSGWVRFGREDGQGHYLTEVATSVAFDTQGRVVLGGYSEVFDDQSHQQEVMLVRTTPTGQLDTTFNGTGYFDLNMIGSFATSAIAIDAYNDGIIVAANITNTASVLPGALLTRVKRTGVLDTNFGQGGLVTLRYDEGTNITALAVRRDRRIVAAGWIDPTGIDTRDFFAARTGNGVNRYSMPFAVHSIDMPYAMTLSGERPVIAGILETDEILSSFASGVLRLQSDAIFENDFD